MAATPAERADRTETAVRACLDDGNPRAALNAVLHALQGEARKLDEDRPADGHLAYAQLAGSLMVTAANLWRHRPERPPGCGRYPGPADLTAAFEAAADDAIRSLTLNGAPRA
jgi:hypothetical protein